MAEERIHTGVPGLDEILHGGLVARRTYLVVGGTGTGKTVLSLQWLREGYQRGETALYITLAEPASEVVRNVAGFGWSLEGIGMLDLSPTGGPEEAGLGEYHVFSPGEVERVPVWQAIYQALQEKRPQRVVIDSVTQLRHLSTDEYQFRKQILGLVAFLNRAGCTSLLTFEPSELDQDTSVALAVDGVIRLQKEVSSQRVIDLRSIQVEKLRGSDYMSGLHPMRITARGIVVFPHRVEEADGGRPGAERLASGIPELDELLGGGIESGTTTLISGPSGAGKTTLGMQFLTQGAAHGRPALGCVFEESPAFVLSRCRVLGMPVDELQARGALRLVQVNPLQLYPDEFLSLIRKAIETEGCRLVMVDSVRGYQLAMEQFGSLTTHLHNLVTYLNRNGATTFLINEVENITGDLQFSELGISYLVDNGLFLRYAEVDGRVIRVVGCLKKRLGDFQPELRPLSITSEGLRVGGPLKGLRGLLTGVPERAN